MSKFKPGQEVFILVRINQDANGTQGYCVQKCEVVNQLIPDEIEGRSFLLSRGTNHPLLQYKSFGIYMSRDEAQEALNRNIFNKKVFEANILVNYKNPVYYISNNEIKVSKILSGNFDKIKYQDCVKNCGISNTVVNRFVKLSLTNGVSILGEELFYSYNEAEKFLNNKV